MTPTGTTQYEMEHGVEYQAVLVCEDRMAAVGQGEKVDVVDGVPGGVGERLAVAVPVEVRVAVGVDEGVAVEEAELMVVPLSVGVPVLVVSWLAWAAAKTASVTAARASARALDWWNICQAK